MSANGINVRPDGVVEVSGRMTFHTVPEYIGHAAKWLNGGHDPATFDLGKVELVDSAGIALMLEWMAQARAKRRGVKFVNLPEQVRHLIGVSGLDEAFGL